MIPLWLPDNKTQDSPIFYVDRGQVAVLVAVGFERHRVRTTSTEFVSPQLACIHRLIFKYGMEEPCPLEPTSYCSFLYTRCRETVAIIADEVMWNKHCMWSVGGCDNIKLIPIPGAYYLRLNDETAVGKAQVFVDMLDFKDVPLELMKDFLP